jgi:hypothetical protein
MARSSLSLSSPQLPTSGGPAKHTHHPPWPPNVSTPPLCIVHSSTALTKVLPSCSPF